MGRRRGWARGEDEQEEQLGRRSIWAGGAAGQEEQLGRRSGWAGGAGYKVKWRRTPNII